MNFTGNETLVYELTINESNQILSALQELPAKICNPLSDKMRQQAEPQLHMKTANKEAAAKEVLEKELEIERPEE